MYVCFTLNFAPRLYLESKSAHDLTHFGKHSNKYEYPPSTNEKSKLADFMYLCR